MEVRREKTFPRGGRQPALFKSNKNSSFSFLKKPAVKSKQKKKNKKVSQSQKSKTRIKTAVKESNDGFYVKFVEDLKPSIIQDGMLILGIVSKVMEKLVKVCLPGGLMGGIALANVSEFYTNLIENSTRNSEVSGLEDIFHEGDVLPVKVLAVSEKHHSLMLTCDPKIINQKLPYNLLEEGLILTGSVKSKEEHGFIIDLGIEHVQSFLKFEKMNKNDTLKIGQLVRCCIIQCSVSSGLCSVQLSTLKRDFQTACIKKNSTLPVYCYIPGFQFEVSVKKILIDGIEVSYKQSETSKGFIHENYFLKKFATPRDAEIGADLIATLLYIKPFVNFLYFKIMPKKESKWPFRYGEIVSGKVMKVKRNGVTFKITKGSEKAKCFVPISKLKGGSESLEKSEVLSLYPLNKKVSKIRLGCIDLMARYYLGATDKASLTEKYYSVSDLKCGEVVSCRITGFGKSTTQVVVGKAIKGIIGFSDMSDVPMKNPMSKFKLGQKVKARVMDIMPEKFLVRLTMKPTLLREKDVLCDLKKCKKNNCYTGTIFRVINNRIVVKFFNNVFGTVPKHLTPYLDSKSLKEHFDKGQLVKCYVVDSDDENGLVLSLSLMNCETKLEVGQKYEATVLNKTVRGLFLEVVIDENTKCKGYLPRTLLTMHRSLMSALHSTYSSGDKLMAYCLRNNIKNEAPIFGKEEIFEDFYEGKTQEELNELLTKSSVVPFLYENESSKTQCMYLKSIVPGTNDCTVVVTRNDFPKEYRMLRYQLIYGKILSVQKKKIEVSTKLHDVWKKDFHESLYFLNSYLKSMESLVLRQYEKLNAYNQKMHVGCPVKGVIEEVKPSHAIVRTENGDLGIAEGKFTQGQEIGGKVIWIDGPKQIFHISTKIYDSENNTDKRRSSERVNYNARGKVAYINEELIVLELIGRRRGELAFFPRKRHLNDIEKNECVIGMGEILKLWITRKNSNYLLAMDRRIVDLQEKIIWKKSEKRLRESVQNLKRKLESEKLERLKKRRTESDEIEVVDMKLCDKSTLSDGDGLLPEVKEEKDDDNEVFKPATGIPRLEYDDVDIKSEADTDEADKQTPTDGVRNEERIILSSSSEGEDEDEPEKKIETAAAFKVDFNWEVLNNTSLLAGALLKEEEESSSDDEDEESKHDKKKRRRLTGIEKKEKAKSEEERLRSIEERLMDADREPESADDFDRAVLANPNSSALWLKYMAFHIQGTEIEKARAVARRALKAISFREEQEKLNVWIALLNLENLYGNEESLQKTLGEALQVNEPYKIHLHMLGLHGQSNKLQEMERLGNFMLKKYKDMENMWCDVAAAYFAVGKVESARNVLQKALGIVQKSQHVPLISKFAQLENKYGSPERAQTLYESILASYPKRVDIWCCYVDMLIKSNHIDLARQVLERATSQSLRPRKMKTLFKKFLAFEEAHGTPESVDKVREAAVEYVETVGGAEV